nr:MAG TPA: hypothetical protein [Caudoviricetes sp.]
MKQRSWLNTGSSFIFGAREKYCFFNERSGQIC